MSICWTPAGVCSVTVSPIFAFSSARAIGEIQLTWPMIQIDLVDTDDRHRMRLAVVARIVDGRAEEHLIDVLLLAAVDDFRQIEPLGQKANPPVDFAQAPLAIDIIAVLRAIAIRCRPRKQLHDLRTLDVEQMQQFVPQPPIARPA